MLKRVADIIISLLILFFALPVFLLFLILIKIDSKGMAIFRQKRVGKEGREFILYKFRTMQIDTPVYGQKPKEDDIRITGFGKLLRYTGLDELPQLFNVLKADMSLVGPRPEMPFIVKNYTENDRQRLAVKPGITGLWQVSGKTKIPILDNLQYDLEYIDNQSIVLDFKILSKTLRLFFNNLLHLFR